MDKEVNKKKATIRFICQPKYDDIMKSQNDWLSITQTNPLVTIFIINNTKVTPILEYVSSDQGSWTGCSFVYLSLYLKEARIARTGIW